MTNQNFLNSNYKNQLKTKIEVKKKVSNFVHDPSSNIFFNSCFDKNQLKNLIAWFLNKYGEKITLDFLEALKQVGFHEATRAGVSLGIDDLQIPSQKALLLSQALVKLGELTNANKLGDITSVEKSQRLIDTWNQTSEILRQTAVQNFRITNPVNPVFMMAFSGARGNISQVRQLVAMRGLMADPQGAILEFPIQSNFREGLTITEYLISCYGARKGLVDTALRTATSGYLTRRLVDAVQHVVVVMTDCKTKKGILLKNKNLEQRLLGRVLLEDIVLNPTTIIKKNTLISQKLAKIIASNLKQVYVRSPLTCNTEKSVCQLCYGLNLAQGKIVSLGEAVGVIAGQSIGEPGTQLTMRTFHTGGVGVFSDQSMKSFNAPFEGKIQFLETLAGLFVRTPHGNIVYLLKYIENRLNKTILSLKSFHSISQVYEISQNDIPSGSILWVKQGEFVKTGQLLLQASQIKTSKQQMPESSHPVQAPYSGEVFFESMLIRIIQKQTQFKAKKTIKKEADLSPKFRTLTELGNFWVFSSFIQKESSISNSFFVKGDLLSPDTPVLQYNFTIPRKGQLKQVNSNLVLGETCFEFLLSKSYYSKSFYFLIQSDSLSDVFDIFLEKKKKKEEERQKHNKKNIFVSNNHPNNPLIIWYPNLTTFDTKLSGYCSIISNTVSFLPQKGSEFYDRIGNEKNKINTRIKNEIGTKIEKRNKNENIVKSSSFFNTSIKTKNLGFNLVSAIPSFTDILTQKRDFSTQTSLFWSEHQVFKLKASSFCYKWLLDIGKTSFFFMNNLPVTISKKGIFLFKFVEKIKWSEKIIFLIKINKNFTKFKLVFFSNFMQTALKESRISIFRKAPNYLIQKEQGWFYVPEKTLTEIIPTKLNSIILEPGKEFENISFFNSIVSVSLIQTQDIYFLKVKMSKNQFYGFYSLSTLLNTKTFFNKNNKFFIDDFIKKSLNNNDFKLAHRLLTEKKTKTKPKLLIFNKKFFNKFCFYSLFFRKKNINLKLNSLPFKVKRKRQIENILFFQKNSHQFLPDIRLLKQNWYLQNKLSQNFSIKSPLFNKQFSTNFEKKITSQLRFNLVIPFSYEWISVRNLLKLEIKITGKCFNCGQNFSKFKYNFHSIKSNSLLTCFSFMFYTFLKLQNAKQFCFQTFANSNVLPELKITNAFLKSKKLGEFRHLQIQKHSVSFSILQTSDLISFKLPLNLSVNGPLKPKIKLLKIGSIVRWGQEILPGFAIPVSGQIFKITKKTLTIRKGISILASARGVVHVFSNDLIQKNDLLITLKSRRLQTEDIVQGIPKIEQLFEARETQGGEVIFNSAHSKLQNFFRNNIQSKPLRIAVNQSLYQIQNFLVENILEAYSNQGVRISEKHVEIVVRQMTARVRILSGGDTGLLPGETVQLKWIERINNKLASLGCRQANYEPMILGITKSVLQSESFLVAASFQEVSRVLVRSALTKKTDFLRGLHENVIIGQLIPAGTGIISRNSFEKNSLLE